MDYLKQKMPIILHKPGAKDITTKRKNGKSRKDCS